MLNMKKQYLFLSVGVVCVAVVIILLMSGQQVARPIPIRTNPTQIPTTIVGNTSPSGNNSFSDLVATPTTVQEQIPANAEDARFSSSPESPSP